MVLIEEKEKKGIKVPNFSGESEKKTETAATPTEEPTFSFKTGKIEVSRPEIAAIQVPKSEAGTFENPAKEDLQIVKGKVSPTINFDVEAIQKAVEENLKKAKETEFLSVNRIPTGVPGLDEVMSGGFERNSVNLIGGGAGSGKSIICMQFIVNGVKNYDEPGIYISFEETKDKFFKHMATFGWDLAKLEKGNKFVFIQYTPAQVKKVIQEGGGVIEAEIERIGARRVVIDSLTAFTLLYENELSAREAVLSLFEMLYKWGCTTLVVSEQEPDPDKHVSNIMEFEADGVILLYNIRRGDIRERALEIFKLRGSKHAQKIFPMKISDNGIIIYPEETVF